MTSGEMQLDAVCWVSSHKHEELPFMTLVYVVATPEEPGDLDFAGKQDQVVVGFVNRSLYPHSVLSRRRYFILKSDLLTESDIHELKRAKQIDASQDYIMVPKKPDVGMIGAWYRYKNGHHFHDERPPEDRSDVGAYRAMIDARPVDAKVAMRRFTLDLLDCYWTVPTPEEYSQGWYFSPAFLGQLQTIAEAQGAKVEQKAIQEVLLAALPLPQPFHEESGAPSSQGALSDRQLRIAMLWLKHSRSYGCNEIKTLERLVEEAFKQMAEKTAPEAEAPSQMPYCTDCEMNVTVNSDRRCCSCGDGRVVGSDVPHQL